MYEYRLWIELSESTEESDCGHLIPKIEELRTFAEKLNCKPADPFLTVNYSFLCQCAGGANHRGTEHESLLIFLQRLVEILPGSYGIVYWSDDELSCGTVSNSYKVLVIARGKVQERFDPFLSPKNPVVED